MKFEKLKERYGCVVRSLEYATGVRATDAEYRQSIKEGLYGRDAIQIIRNSDIPPLKKADEEWRCFRKNERTRRLFMRHVCRTNTPLGKALSMFTMSEQTMTGAKIKQQMNLGHTIIVFPWEHSACLDYSKTGDLTCVSDNPPEKLLIEDNEKMLVLKLMRR